MADREKVMTWLEICGKNRDCSGTCPYSENGFGEYGECRETLMTDALSLLKEQEAVEPKWFIDGHNPAGAFRCGACGERILEKNIDFYCSKCGKPVLWEGR